MQFGQQFRNAGVQLRIVRPAFRVLGGNNFPASLHSFVVLMVFRQNTPGQTARAVADKTPVTFNRMCRKAQLLQTGVRSAGDIGKCVKQRAVEVEKYGLKFDGINLP